MNRYDHVGVDRYVPGTLPCVVQQYVRLQVDDLGRCLRAGAERNGETLVEQAEVWLDAIWGF